ncbi:RNA-directed DNA polymerase (reversetranscriptase)-related family protein [Striga asiatica]|uniref:RNA-directed DNA polymerase (Reversetranscriptase)-related family protein n=1 Tax=Striga asiatica TaxID=4170 RepID=A0A5A7PZR9_STRAF|nr:RNA-directed DNA polymerase (reversetranscriptase)-related family protein [Striga asiatica]
MEGDALLQLIPTSIKPEMNLELVAPVEEKEVKEAMFSIDPGKAPEQDGSRLLELLGFVFDEPSSQPTRVFMIFVASNQKPEGHSVYKPEGYRRRAREAFDEVEKCLNSCVSENQPVFIPGRRLLDNVIVAQERILLRMGFHSTFVKWIVTCISSVAYFQSEWSEVDRGHFKGIKLARGGPLLTHLLFTDDSLVFYEAECNQAQLFISMLSAYLNVTGKKVLSKAVTDALSVFSMLCFCLPKGVCKELARMCAEFWWSKGDKHIKGLHWKAWKIIILSKE